MLKTLFFDFSGVIFFAKTTYHAHGMSRFIASFTDEKWQDYFYFNQELLDYLKTRTEDKYLLTASTVVHKKWIEDKLSPIFKQIFTTSDFKLSKNDLIIYQKLAKDLTLLPQEILFIDDSSENISEAQKANWQTILYRSNEDLLLKLEKLL